MKYVSTHKLKGILMFLPLTFLIFSCNSEPKETKGAKDKIVGKAQGPLPGVASLDSALLKKIEKKREGLEEDYKPRTRHFKPDGWAKYTNRLFLETSPYLLQHAHNPVNWYPWGDEAFETAKKRKVPVLLSVGYSTCHWCHVMEEESFEDEEIAGYMNENYVAIKVDREERPDVDGIYMTAVQAMTGRGGWPMTVWLTPDRKPFFGGTYFPARDGDRGTRTGFLTLLKRMSQTYQSQPDKIAGTSGKLADVIQDRLGAEDGGGGLPGPNLLSRAASNYKSMLDPKDGGVNRAPKFPSSMPVHLLLRIYRRTQDQGVLDAATLTLDKMAAGGIYDHVGGGFHRYSTDKHWLVPHFEKMLYDNALLVMAYLEAYQVTGNPEYARIVNETLRYISRDMSSPEGVFYSATDADSLTPDGHREEGYFFTWTPSELRQVLGPERMKVFEEYFIIRAGGNFEGRNILHTHTTTAEVAKKLNLPEKEVRDLLEESKDLLYRERNRRPPPLRDEKILTSWNGLMISAFGQAGLILKKPDYISRATRAAQFIFDHLYKDGRLYRSYKDGQAKLNGYLDDYAFLTAGLLDLYEATHDPQWLKKAVALDQTLEKFYEDKKNGGFFMVSEDHEELLAREKPAYDGAEPSGNSVAILNLYRLNEFTTDDRYRQRADRALRSFSKTLSRNPTALSEMLLALDFRYDKPKEIILVAPEGKREEAEILLAEFRKRYLPNRILVVSEAGEELKKHAAVVPLAESKYPLKGKATAYVCEQGICELPTSDPKVFSKQISTVEPL